MRNLISTWVQRGTRSLRGRDGAAAIVQTLAARALIIVVNIATGTITARILGPAGRGEQAAMAIWPQFFAYSLSLGLPSALLYTLKRYPQERSQTFSAAVFLGMFISVFSGVIGVITIPFLMQKYPSEAIHLSQGLMVAVPLVVFTEVLRSAMEASDEFAIANQIRYLPPLSTLALLIVLAVTKQLTPFTAVLSYWLPGIPMLVWMIACAKRFFTIRFTQIQHSIQRLLHYGFRAYGIDLISALAGQIQQVLAISVLAPAAMGLYAIAFSLCQLLYVVQSSFVTVLFPKAAARPVSEVVEMTGRAARISGMLAILMAISMMALAPGVLHLLYGEAYLAAIPIFRVLAIETVLGGTAIILSQAFMATDRPGIVTLIQGIGLMLGAPLILILTPMFGLLGLGLALLVSTMIRLVSVWICYPVVLKTPPPGLWLTHQDLKFIQQKFLSRF
ncbi:oligosaccharide flippase family protein [Leptolyngbya sp. FACHB-17]|uniref:lipopolysaccharide biosynthesis protein n=1 Tax=unclassified Leptolyngbya TaxID=2650499 RepID=UPI001680F995|nr:oligosaccharide flippase family protein [Leptolyngbya sp. FACHB-17]MBD2078404.1 oligosaccharide flippase family protein [Leptolyngbya sp. FACHB-17]